MKDSKWIIGLLAVIIIAALILGCKIWIQNADKTKTELLNEVTNNVENKTKTEQEKIITDEEEEKQRLQEELEKLNTYEKRKENNRIED